MLQDFIGLLRIKQWLKNLMVYFPPFLGGVFFSVCTTPKALLPFVAFCLASSATYIFNDLLDRVADGHHPIKCKRPIASGALTVQTARIVLAILLMSSLVIAGSLSIEFFTLIATYIVVSVAYSSRLKEIPLVDIFCISLGFLLRLQAGGVAFGIRISEWLFLSVFLLSVFLSTGKRLSEKNELGHGASRHRKTLAAYPKGFLDGSMYMTGGAVLVTYTMYAISRHSSLLLYSVPLCCFGLLRYIFRVQVGKGGDPTDSLLRDIPLLLVGVTWAILVGWGIYG